jgi:hypothetical protein
MLVMPAVFPVLAVFSVFAVPVFPVFSVFRLFAMGLTGFMRLVARVLIALACGHLMLVVGGGASGMARVVLMRRHFVGSARGGVPGLAARRRAVLAVTGVATSVQKRPQALLIGDGWVVSDVQQRSGPVGGGVAHAGLAGKPGLHARQFGAAEAHPQRDLDDVHQKIIPSASS